jgi:hypothetical protein
VGVSNESSTTTSFDTSPEGLPFQITFFATPPISYGDHISRERSGTVEMTDARIGEVTCSCVPGGAANSTVGDNEKDHCDSRTRAQDSESEGGHLCGPCGVGVQNFFTSAKDSSKAGRDPTGQCH